MSFLEKAKDFFGLVDELPEQESVEDNQESSPVIRNFSGSLVNSLNAKKFMASEIKVIEPRIYEDSLNIAMFLRENIPVIINLKYLDGPASKRLIDFICGTAYAINGHMMKIGENIFLFTPANVQIVESSEKTTFEQGLEQEEKEVFFKKAAL